MGQLTGRGLSVRRACVLLRVARSAVGYPSRQAAKDAPLLRTLQRLARRHPRWGYRRIWAALRRRGEPVNRKRVERLWRQADLALPRRRTPKKWRTGERVAPVAQRPNAVWASDILHERCANGQRVRCLTVVDEYTKECLAIVVATQLSAERVVTCLAGLVERYGAPQYLRTDNGPEFVGHWTQTWLAAHEIVPARIAPGQPWQNGVVESFHSRLRDECLNREWLASAAEAAVILERYRQTYNAERPHSSLGYRTPVEVRAGSETGGDTAFLPGKRVNVSL
ncbi:MAG TPA: IS3 family transposase [Gemmatimonadales bacterium]|nr:IS3 family transposase [Gemmatimonadales bacterium]